MTHRMRLGQRQGVRAWAGGASICIFGVLLVLAGCRAELKGPVESAKSIPETPQPPVEQGPEAEKAELADPGAVKAKESEDVLAKMLEKAEAASKEKKQGQAGKLMKDLLAGDAKPATPKATEKPSAPEKAPAETKKPAGSSEPKSEMEEALNLLARAVGPEQGKEVTRGGPEKKESPKPAPGPEPKKSPPTTAKPPPAPAKAAPKPIQVASAKGANPAPAPAQAPPPPARKERPPRPPGKSEFYTFFHKSADEFLRFLDYHFPDYVQKGHVTDVVSKPSSVMLFGDDKVIQELTKIADDYDNLDLKLEREILRPKYIDVAVVMEAINMAGIANVWHRVDENIVTNFYNAKGKVQKTATHKHSVYAKTGISAGTDAPIFVPLKIPYIFEMPWTEPFQIPKQNTGKATNASSQTTTEFNQTPSSEVRGVLVAVGTREDLENIRSFLTEIDRPARRIMIEVQLIELDAKKFLDIGVDSFQLGQRHSITTGAFNFPGEPLSQPGISNARRDGDRLIVPETVSNGLSYMFDDTTVDLSGRFMTTINLLEITGDAIVKARPRILALDDRQSILHIGEEVPTFQSTGVSREVTGGVFVENISRVSTQYVGFTLNMRPRVSGLEDDEVTLELEVVSNRLTGRTQVFQEDLAGIPNVNQRKFIGQTRVRNHRPIILGGLIQEEEVESINKIPILGDIPVLKYLFSRTQTENRRIEVILVITPHILSDNIPDRMATPKESIHFDTYDSVLFNDRHIIKGRDVQGIDPITKQPTVTLDGMKFTEKDVIDLTLLKIVKERKLVSKLGIFDEYLPVESRKHLGWLKRKFPERSVYYWDDNQKEVYYKAAAIVIENIKELNPDLDYIDIVTPRREIVLPTTPYRMTLSYDKYKIYMEKGKEVLRGERVDLTPAIVDLIKEAGDTRTLREFAEFVERTNIEAESHAELKTELERLYRQLNPQGEEPGKEGYAQLYRDLADANIDFMVIATFFEGNLAERYKTVGAPNVGTFEQDLVNFLKSSITIQQRAKRLKELDNRWENLYSDEEEMREVNWEEDEGNSDTPEKEK